jgi:hypothetical protein
MFNAKSGKKAEASHQLSPGTLLSDSAHHVLEAMACPMVASSTLPRSSSTKKSGFALEHREPTRKMVIYLGYNGICNM